MQTTAPVIPRLGLLLACLLAARAAVAAPPTEVARQQIAALALAVTAFERDVGRFPAAAEGLRALVERPAGPAAERWNGPYLEPSEVPRDPWGNAYGYVARPEDAERPFSVYSRGPDGVSASAGDDPDDVGLWAAPSALADAPAPSPLRALAARLLRGPLASIVVLTVVVALLKRHAGRVARQAQPHVDGYVRRHHRGRQRPAGTRAPPQGQGNIRA